MCDLFEASGHVLLGLAACIGAVGSVLAARASREGRDILKNGKERDG